MRSTDQPTNHCSSIVLQQGTRLHIYEWDKRFLLDEDDLLEVAHGKKLSIPTSNTRWTDKYTPGLDVFAYHKNPRKLEKALRKYLGPLIEFAKHVLKDKEEDGTIYRGTIIKALDKMDSKSAKDPAMKKFLCKVGPE